uniref:hypothetical protein n=1 Tax=Candidatus Fimivicinus sp. TaxID=3056640 RepID=UPI003FEDFE4E
IFSRSTVWNETANHYHAGFCPLFKPIRQKQPKPLPFYKTSESSFRFGDHGHFSVSFSSDHLDCL